MIPSTAFILLIAVCLFYIYIPQLTEIIKCALPPNTPIYVHIGPPSDLKTQLLHQELKN